MSFSYLLPRAEQKATRETSNHLFTPRNSFRSRAQISNPIFIKALHRSSLFLAGIIISLASPALWQEQCFNQDGKSSYLINDEMKQHKSKWINTWRDTRNSWEWAEPSVPSYSASPLQGHTNRPDIKAHPLLDIFQQHKNPRRNAQPFKWWFYECL